MRASLPLILRGPLLALAELDDVDVFDETVARMINSLISTGILLRFFLSHRAHRGHRVFFYMANK
jgi:hypothetical protein